MKRRNFYVLASKKEKGACPAFLFKGNQERGTALFLTLGEMDLWLVSEELQREDLMKLQDTNTWGYKEIVLVEGSESVCPHTIVGYKDGGWVYTPVPEYFRE